jgi:hypothetical protein
MSVPTHDSEMQARVQEVDLNDVVWGEVVTTKLPANLEEQARQYKAWSRKRGISRVSNLLRALLVYACCQYSLRELGMWAVLKGIGFTLRAGMAQTAGTVTRLDWVVAFRTLRSASKASLVTRRSGTSAYRGCDAMENTRRDW